METRAHFVIIGAIVLILVSIAFFFVLWLGGNRAEYDEYDVIFSEGASGLSSGSPVRFNGIQKGEVGALTISEDDPTIVRARIRVESDTPVTTSTKAKLELVGFTGLAVIQLRASDKNAPLLKDEVRGIPQIQAEPSGFAAFLEGSGDIVEAVLRLLSEDNTDSFGRILSSIDKAVAALAENDEEIGQTIRNTAILTHNLADASESLAKAAEDLDVLIARDATGALTEARETMAELQILIKDVQVVVEENREPLNVFSENGLAQVGPTLAEARRAFRTLDEVLREIDRDPRGYLLNESTPQVNGGQE
ncbi:MAG: MCE family protein [Parvularculaceae bacterium]|nr:MAG: MCE family protein [Parvularculaceae bacterium]